ICVQGEEERGENPPSCWKHLPKRIQVKERDTAFPIESQCLPNSASAERLAFPGALNIPSPIVLRPRDDQPNHLHCSSIKIVKPVILLPYLCSLSESNC
ncbi:hypothetical protein AMECASPLE_036095, partial [Ameca splendens]